MANTKISQLPAATTPLTGTELVPIVQNGVTVNVTAQNLNGGASGGGAVTQVSTGTGLTGGPITTFGTISIANTAVTPGTYTNPSVTVNAQGQVTSASSGSTPVTSVSGTANEITSSGGATPTLSLPSALTFTGKTVTGGIYTGATVENTPIGGTTPAAGTFTTMNTTSGNITSAPTTTNSIVNKAYADAVATGLTFHANCNLATTTALPTCTYNNGTSGVGATLTATANGLLTVDSVSAVLGYRILVKDQASQVQNGIYTVSQVGSGSLPFILTRATDYNTPGTTYQSVDAGDFTLILAGTVNAGTSWVQTVLPPITIGSTGLNFVQFGSGTVLYSASTGLDLSGTNQFSIANTGVSSATYGSASAVPQIGVNAQGQITSASNTNIAISGSQVTSGSVAINRGGTGQTAQAAGFNALSPITTLGDLIVGTGTNTAARLGIGSSNQVLTVSGGTATWATPSGATTPGGNNTQFQYNKGGILGGLPNLTTDGTNTQVNNSSALRFSNATTNYVAFKAPVSLSANTTWTLPGTDGTSGQTMVTNGSGTLTWATPTLTPVAPTNYALPEVSGTATVGQTLSCTTGGWNGYPAPTYAYQWVRGAATNISGATSSTYTLVDADYNNTVKCTVTATNSAGSASATSAATATVAGTVPGAPTIGTATAGNAQAAVSFTAPANTGGPAITSYTATSSPGGFTASGASSPLTVSGLTNGTAYTFTVTATNSVGTGTASSASNSVTPTAAPVTDASFSYVPLLLETTSTNGQNNQGTTTTNGFLDSSTNNFTITRNGTPTQGSITPYWPNGQWSNYFNGSTDYLSATNATTVFQFGSSPYTIEGWIYLTATPGNQYICGGVFSNPSYQVIINSSGFIFGSVSGVGNLTAATTAIPLNTWTHFAIVRTSTSASGGAYYINGAPAGTFTDSANISGTTTTLNVGTTNNTGSVGLNGYLSNLRVVKGVAVYTGTFTPPTSPLAATQSSGTNISAITGTQTSLLTCQSNRFVDSSAQVTPATFTATGTPRVQAFQPFSPAAAYTPAAYAGSGYFNGSTDYLSSTITAVSPSIAVFECWLYNLVLESTGTGNHYIQVDGAQTNYLISNNTTGGVRFLCKNDSGTTIFDLISATGVLKINQWQYVVGIRNATTASVYVDGARVATGSATVSTSTGTTLRIGSNLGSGRFLNGYISNVRIQSGTLPSGYDPTSTTIAVPTTPLAAVTGTLFLSNMTNAGIYDATTQNVVTTVADAQVSTTQSKWSPTSMRFDGTGDWLTVLDSPQLQLGTGDFVIDGWVYLSANGIVYGLVSKGTATTGWSVNVTVLNKLQFSYTTSNLTGTTSLATGTWYYFAVVRSGSATGNLKLYLNASLEATSGGAVTDNFNQTSILYVGADRIGASALNGYLQDVRVTKAARTITLPTASFPVQ